MTRHAKAQTVTVPAVLVGLTTAAFLAMAFSFHLQSSISRQPLLTEPAMSRPVSSPLGSSSPIPIAVQPG